MKRKRKSKVQQLDWILSKLDFRIFALTCQINLLTRKENNMKKEEADFIIENIEAMNYHQLAESLSVDEAKIGAYIDLIKKDMLGDINLKEEIDK